MLDRPKPRHQLFLNRQIGVPGIEFLGRYCYHAAAPALKPHLHHGAVEICLLFRGEQSYRVGKQLYRLRGGWQFVTFPDETHDTAGQPEEPGELCWLIVRLVPDLLFLPPAHARSLAAALRVLPSRHFRAAKEAPALIGEIFHALRQPSSHLRAVVLAGLFNRYFMLTLKASAEAAGRSPTAPIQRCLDRVEQHPSETLHLAGLAALARLSLSRFKTRFKREVGVPPAEYVLRRKVDAARVLLEGGRFNVTEAAFEMGFSSSQYFATVFRRYTGVSPRTLLRRTARP